MGGEMNRKMKKGDKVILWGGRAHGERNKLNFHGWVTEIDGNSLEGIERIKYRGNQYDWKASDVVNDRRDPGKIMREDLYCGELEVPGRLMCKKCYKRQMELDLQDRRRRRLASSCVQ